MMNFIRVEWMKVRHYSAFWIISALFVVGVVGLNFIVYGLRQAAEESSGKQATAMLFGSPYAYPDVWQTVSWMSGWLLFVPGMLIITLISNEYTFKTHRQNIIDGWTRTEFITVKWLWVLVFSVMAAVVAFLTALLFGALGHTPFSTKGMYYVGWYFLEAISYLGAALLIGVLIRRAGLGIVLFFLYVFILKYLLAYYLNRMGSARVGEYLPLTISDDLIPFPFLREVIKGKLPDPPALYYLLTGSVVYPAIFYWWMSYKFRTDDL